MYAYPEESPDDNVVPSTGLPWLDVLDRRIEEECKEEFGEPDHHRIVRSMLLAPDDDDDESAVPKAIESFKEDYIAGFSGEDFGMRKPPEYSAGVILNSIAVVIFETVQYVPFMDIRHDRLANLLIGIKSSASQDFSEADPHFVYYGWGLEAAAAETWNSSKANGSTQDNEHRTANHAANCWASTAALLAKLYKAGLLDNDGPLWMSADFEKAFERPAEGELATNIGRQSQILVAANYILISGEPLVKEVKTPSQKWWFELSAKRWRLWASGLQEAASIVSEDAEWGLKARAQQAHSKMIELYPEAFKDNQ